MAQAFRDAEIPLLEHVARAALERWGLPSSSATRLVNLSENATYVVDPPHGDRVVLRVGRPDYSTAAEVASELMWVEALRADGAARTPPVVRTPDGATVAEIAVPDLPGTRACAVFGFVPGSEPGDDGDLVVPFRVLGGLAARIHAHGRAWTPPSSFIRRRWTYETTIGGAPSWGRWEDAVDVGPAERDLLERVCEQLVERLEAYGTGPDRHGLVHADLRLGNTLFDGEDVCVIDFDDAGYSWLLWDLATGLTFTEHHENLPELVAAWLEGYREVAPLSDEVVAIAPTLIMLRRLHVLAWLGSHGYSELAQREGPVYTADTCALAERYLAGRGLGM